MGLTWASWALAGHGLRVGFVVGPHMGSRWAKLSGLQLGSTPKILPKFSYIIYSKLIMSDMYAIFNNSHWARSTFYTNFIRLLSYLEAIAI